MIIEVNISKAHGIVLNIANVYVLNMINTQSRTRENDRVLGIKIKEQKQKEGCVDSIGERQDWYSVMTLGGLGRMEGECSTTMRNHRMPLHLLCHRRAESSGEDQVPKSYREPAQKEICKLYSYISVFTLCNTVF